MSSNHNIEEYFPPTPYPKAAKILDVSQAVKSPDFLARLREGSKSITSWATPESIAIAEAKDGINFPPLSTRLKSFTQASISEAHAIAKGVAATSQEETDRRFAICKACDFFLPEKAECSKCGCPMRRKTAWRSTQCPLPTPKWGPVI